MSKPSVYLAGPISGLTYDDSEGWRLIVREKLAPEVDAFSPLRSKNYLRKEGKLKGAYDYAALSTGKGITTRDRFDVMTSDLILVNFTAWKIVSMGTLIELGWADVARRPVVGIWRKTGEENYSLYPMIQEIVGWWTEDIDEAVDLVKAILLP